MLHVIAMCGNSAYVVSSWFIKVRNEQVAWVLGLLAAFTFEPPAPTCAFQRCDESTLLHRTLHLS